MSETFFDENRPYFFWGVGSKAALYEPGLDRFIMASNDIETLTYVRYAFTNKFPLIRVCTFNNCHNWLHFFPDALFDGLDNTNCIWYGLKDKDDYPLLPIAIDQKFLGTLEYSVRTICYHPNPPPGHELLFDEIPNMFALYRLLRALNDLRGSATVRIPKPAVGRYWESIQKYDIMDAFSDQSADVDFDLTHRHITLLKDWKNLRIKVLETAMYSKEFDFEKLAKLVTDEYNIDLTDLLAMDEFTTV